MYDVDAFITYYRCSVYQVIFILQACKIKVIEIPYTVAEIVIAFNLLITGTVRADKKHNIKNV